jgi:prepilin-type N-terminal cleavage/methylation domain-containing protein
MATAPNDMGSWERTMRTRKGFTLVELMVAMALTIFLMLILTQAFVLSIDTFVGLKGVGDMQENLRAGANALRFDLQQAHLEGDRRPSDPSLAGQPPREGFFRIYQNGGVNNFPVAPGTNSTIEGSDLNPNGPYSYYASNHILHFASRLKGNQRQSFYSTSVGDPNFFQVQSLYGINPAANAANAQLAADATMSGGTTFNSQWAEIAYFLIVQGTTEEPLNPTGAGQALYGLYRAQFLVVTDSTNLNINPAYTGLANAALTLSSNFGGVACNVAGTNIVFFTPNDLAKNPSVIPGQWRTFNPATAPTTQAGLQSSRAWLASLVVPNVVSFLVQGISSTGATPQDGNYDSANSPPVLQGVNITLRVWDNKTRQTRQLSIMQDL